MAKEITPDDVECFGRAIEDGLSLLVAKTKLVTANNAKAIIKRRIFNEGKNAEESALKYPSPKGQRVGSYSATHARTRGAKGRQTSKVDFQLTDRLFNSIQVQSGPKGPFLGIEGGARSDGKITNQELAGALEENYKVDVFTASQDEASELLDAAEDEAFNFLERIVKNCL